MKYIIYFKSKTKTEIDTIAIKLVATDEKEAQDAAWYFLKESVNSINLTIDDFSFLRCISIEDRIKELENNCTDKEELETLKKELEEC